MSRRKRQDLRTIFAVPLVIALLSCIGLVTALAGDGAGDWIAWITLAVPVIVVGWAMGTRRS